MVISALYDSPRGGGRKEQVDSSTQTTDSCNAVKVPVLRWWGGALQRGRPVRSGMEMQFAAVLHFSLGDLYSGVCSAFVWLLLLPNNTAPESQS